MARLIGDAYIVIYPQTDAFGPQLEAAIKKYTAAMKPTVSVLPTLDKAAAATVAAELKGITGGEASVGVTLDPATLAAARAALDALKTSGVITLDPTRALASIDDIAARTAVVQEALASLRANVDDTAAEAQLARLGVQATALSKALEKAPDDADWAPFEARLLAIEAAYEKISAAKLTLDDAEATTSLELLAAQAGDLRVELANYRATIDDSAAVAKMAALQAQAVSLSRSLTFAPADADLAPFEAQLLGIVAGYDKVKEAQASEDEELVKQTGLFAGLGLQGPGSLIHITDILNASLPEVDLFSGAVGALYAKIKGGDAELPALANHLTNVASSAHLTAEAAIEFTAIWAPATIALVAFGAAATPAVITITKQIANMNTAAKGTGQAFASLASSSASVTAAVKPTVLEAFGTALYAVQNHSSTLATAMHTLGQGIDEFAAKAAVAFDSNSASKFFTTGAADALNLVQSFESLGSILGSLLKVVPGYAEVLLDFGNNLLKGAADATAFIEPVLKVGVALHGALFYGGLAGTAVGTVFSKLVPLAIGASGAISNLFAKFLGDENLVSVGAGKVVVALEDMGTGPILGISVLVGLLAAVVIYMKASSDAAQQFDKSIQSMVSSASLGALQSTIQSGIVQTTVQYVAAQKNLAAASKTATDAMSAEADAGRGGEAQLLNNDLAIQKAQASAAQYGGALQQLTQQQTNVNTNLGELAKTFGTSIPGALSLANGAQVTSNQLTQVGAENTATLNAQVEGYVTQLSVMTAGSGTLNEALNALNVTQSTQITDAQKLASAYSAWIGIVTGGDSSFTTFEQAQATLVDTLGGKVTPAVVTSTTASVTASQAIDKLGGTSATTSKSVDALGGTSSTASQSLTKLAAGGKDVTTSLSKTADAGQNVTTSLKNTAAGGQDVTNTLSKTSSATTAAATAADSLTVKIGNLTEKFSAAGATMNGTSVAALAARQAFDAQIVSATTLYGNLQTMAAASGNSATAQVALAAAGKDVVAQMLPLAAGSKEATAEVYSLAQIAGYQGPDSFQKLAQWVGNTTGAEADLNKQQTILTLSTANLTAAAKNLSSAVSQEITTAEATAISKTDGFTTATLNLAQAFDASGGAASKNVQLYATDFYNSLIRAGTGTTQATQQVNAFLTQMGAAPAVLKTVDAVIGNVTAQSALTTATKQNMQALQLLGGTITTTSNSYTGLFTQLAKEDTGLTKNTSTAALAKQAFISFAQQGLNLSSAAAAKLWATSAAQNLTKLASQAGTTQSSFVALATKGLDISNSAAQGLWTTMRLQYLDTLATKAGTTESQFAALATKGLDISNSAAATLWATMRQQYLDTLSAKAGETEAQFVKTAGQLDITTTSAKNLWTALHTVAAGSPYAATVTANINATGDVTAVENSTLAAGQKNALIGELDFAAAGTVVAGGGPSGQDSKLIMAAPGELIVPSSHAPAFSDMARKAGIPGFASGGLVASEPGIAAMLSQIPPTAIKDQSTFAGTAVQAFVTSMVNGAIAAALPATGAATSTQVAAVLTQALAITNTPASWLPALETLVSKESGGNASAVDPILVDGEHATGILQTLPATFAQYALPGYTAGPTNALDDAIASIRYIKAEYGSPANIVGIGRPGTYQGYSAGGMISEPVFGYGKFSGMPYSFAENGPEQVIPGGAATQGQPGLPGMTMYQASTLISLMQANNKLLAQAPYSQAQAINQANATGVRRGYFATSG